MEKNTEANEENLENNETNNVYIDSEISTENSNNDNSSNETYNSDFSRKKHHKTKKSSRIIFNKKMFFLSIFALVLLLAIILPSVLVPIAKNRNFLIIKKAEDFINLKGKPFNAYVIKKDISIPASMLDEKGDFTLEGKNFIFNGHTLTLEKGNLVIGDSSSNFSIGSKNDLKEKKKGGFIVKNGNLTINADTFNSYIQIKHSSLSSTDKVSIKANHFELYAQISSDKSICMEVSGEDENGKPLPSKISSSIFTDKHLIIQKGYVKAFSPIKGGIVVENNRTTLEILGNSSIDSVQLKENAILIQNSRDSEIDKVFADSASINSVFDLVEGKTKSILNIKNFLIHDIFSSYDFSNSEPFQILSLIKPADINCIVKKKPGLNKNKLLIDINAGTKTDSFKIVNIDNGKEKIIPAVNGKILETDITDMVGFKLDKIRLSIQGIPHNAVLFDDSLGIEKYKIINSPSGKIYYCPSDPVYVEFSPTFRLDTPSFTGNFKDNNILDENEFTFLVEINPVDFASYYEIYIDNQLVKVIKHGDPLKVDLGDKLNSVGEHFVKVIAKSNNPNIFASSYEVKRLLNFKKFDINSVEFNGPANLSNGGYGISWVAPENASLFTVKWTDQKGNPQTTTISRNYILIKTDSSIGGEDIMIVPKRGTKIKITINEKEYYLKSNEKIFEYK